MQYVDQPLRRPTARLRRALGWLQMYLGVGVVLAAVLVGHPVQVGIDARPADPSPAVLPESVRPGGPTVLDTAAQSAGVTGGGAIGDGAVAAIGVLTVGWTLVASAGTVGRRRLDEHESARWAADWKRVEPAWSGRVSEGF